MSELPPPPSGKTGWPWTEESTHLPGGSSFPRITVVTPSFNQGRFLEETIRSILLQGYPDLEYLVLDGGSIDESVEIIRKYSPWITHWVSEKDAGQSDAINRGLKSASGVFGTWINSDDLLCKDALVRQAAEVGFNTDTIYVGNCLYVDEHTRLLASHRARIHSLEDLLRVREIWRSDGQIVQPEVIFPIDLALKVGGLDVHNHCTMDYDLWGRFFLAGASFQYTDIDFAMFRRHGSQKTQDSIRQTRSLLDVARKLADAGSLSDQKRQQVHEELNAYDKIYPVLNWKDSGRLARLGLPRQVVMPLRSIKSGLRKTAQILFGATAKK